VKRESVHAQSNGPMIASGNHGRSVVVTITVRAVSRAKPATVIKAAEGIPESL
jgi:hypothetical protein